MSTSDPMASRGRRPRAPRRLASRALAALAVLASSQAWAEAPATRGELAVGLWSSSRMLDDRDGTAAARLAFGMDWAVADGVQVSADAMLAHSPQRLDGRRGDAELREFYLRLADVPCAPVLGKRLVLWGRADGINPTDLVAPTNHRLLAPESEDQRTGVWGAHFDCQAGGGNLQVHVVDRFEQSRVPIALPAGVVFRETRHPDADPVFAVRYDRLGSAADWSVSAVSGYDPFPTLALRGVSAQGVELGTRATRMRMLGADLAMVRGRAALRGEIAWVDYARSRDPRVAPRRSHTSLVAGAEWSLREGETLGAQVFWKRLRDAPPPPDDPVLALLREGQALISNELDRDQYGVTVRYAKAVFDTRGDFDLFLVAGRPRRDWLLRARYGYAITDSLRVEAGIDHFRGGEDSFLGRLRDNSLGFVELAHSW